MAIAMNADQRTGTTKGELRQLRLQGKIPGVIYGKQLDNAAQVTVDSKELQALLRSHPNAVLEINVPSHGKTSVMISEIQRDSLSRQVLHVDFHQINMNENVRANVRITAEGDSQGVREGGILQVILHELEVQCLPGNIPDSVSVDISALAIGESVLVSDLKLPKGVESLAEPEQVVVTILAPQKELTEEEAEDAAVELAEAESRSKEAQLEGIKSL
ncbi:MULTISPECIES: 50S ribosomal protein L25/general stress protein Ctc [Bacillales]|uniref:50S ribosomal protein L25/general stress protein Ctc n=1 Tax=Bacillales TaxID=1385 RepID=UPI0006A79359|nr:MULTISPECIES: 50S ribosomal protein L25/general stress protein Ctc [Bacillales]OBZ15505.1 50S ribosomal protein L25 [Bacillus sp. FJAT-26390]